MRRGTMVFAALVVIVAFGAARSVAIACGFDGALGANFSALHPGSLAVAFAVRDAVAKGLLDRAAIAPIERGPKGYWRAASRVQGLQRLMSAARPAGGAGASVSLLFIESQLWSRLTPQPDGYQTDLHMSGPTSGDVVIVTNETVLASVLAGALKARLALDLGLIVVDGDRRAAETVAKAIADLDRTPLAAMAPTPVRPVPFVGRRQ